MATQQLKLLMAGLIQELPAIHPSTELPGILTGLGHSTTAVHQLQQLVAQSSDFDPQDKALLLRTAYPGIFSYYHFFRLYLRFITHEPSGPPSRKARYYSAAHASLDRFRARHLPWYLLELTPPDQLATLAHLPAEYANPLTPLLQAEDLPLPAMPLPAHHPSRILAWMKATMRLEEIIEQRSRLLSPVPGTSITTPLQWTASKTALVELIYALQEYGVFNQSRLEISKVADYMSKVFAIDIGNIYKAYENNRLRKKSRTPFIDGLRAALIRRMEQDDLHAL